MTTVLAAVDDSDASAPVLATAAAIARVLGADLRAIHGGTEAPPRLAQEAAAAGAPLTLVGLPAVSAIVDAAAAPEVGAVVLALHRQPVGEHDAGHTALAVLAQTTKPVAVVPPTEPARAEIRRALVPLDGTRAVSAAVASMIRQLAGMDCDVVVLHVFDASTVPRFLDRARDLRMWADEFAARHLPVADVRLEVRVGDVVDATLELAAAEDPDVIVLGWRQELSLERAHVVKRLLVEGRRPIVLIPLPESDE